MGRVFVVLLVFAGCTKPNPAICTEDLDCEGGLVCRGSQCIAQPCTSNDACDEAAPFCIDELCASTCTDDANCPGFGGGTDSPFCVAGTCVACRDSGDCTSSEPYCDAGACRACAAHSECSSELCDFDTGLCIAESGVTYAAPGGSTTSDCTRLEPCSLDRAVSVITPGRHSLKLGSGMHTLTVSPADVAMDLYGPATISGGISLRYSSVKTTLHDLDISDGVSAALKSTNNPRPVLELVRVRTSTVSIDSGTLRVVSSTLTPPVGLFGVTASGGAGDGSTATIERTTIIGGYYGVQVGSASRATITNSVIRDTKKWAVNFLTSATSGTPSLPSTVEFSTFYNTYQSCSPGAIALNVRNSVIVNESPTAPMDAVTGNSCRFDYDLIFPQTTALAYGANNQLNVSPGFVDPVGGDFHLRAASAAVDAADPAATEMADFDGTPRPQGTRSDMGAFEYKP